MNRYCWSSIDEIEIIVSPYVRSDDGARMIPIGAHSVVNEMAIDERLRAFLRVANKEAA